MVVFLENKDGMVYLEDGKLRVIDPEGLGRYPRISAADNVEIYIDGKKEGKEIVVSEDLEGKIEFEFDYLKMQKDLDIEISDNKLKAYLVVKITPEQKLKIKDTQPSNQIIVETEAEEKVFPQLNKKEILDLLNYYNISHGIKHDCISEIAAKEKNPSGRYLIARGRAAEAGENAEIIESEKYKNKENNMFNVIDSIDKGEIVCRKKEAVPGKAGVNVYSERIYPPPVKDIELKAGKNVQLIEDGTKAVALAGGQPKIIRRREAAEVHISKQYVINGDVDKYTGNIKYDGDLLVKGDIQDYFNVDIGNDVKVQGNIANAEIDTRGDLFVRKNIIASKLYIGNYLGEGIISDLRKIIFQLKNLKKAVEEILGEASKRKMNVSNFRTGKVIRLLIENKFQELKSLIIKTNEKISESDQLKKYFKDIVPYFNNIANLERIKNEEFLYKFKDQLEEYLDTQLENSGSLNIYAGYIQNSEINIGGSVIINRLGCYNTKIKAKGSIIVKKRSGFLKGGNYQAEDLIFCSKAGSKLGKTFFRIGKQIYIRESIGTLIIRSDQDRKIIDESRKNINYKVDEAGQLYQAAEVPDTSSY